MKCSGERRKLTSRTHISWWWHWRNHSLLIQSTFRSLVFSLPLSLCAFFSLCCCSTFNIHKVFVVVKRISIFTYEKLGIFRPNLSRLVLFIAQLAQTHKRQIKERPREREKGKGSYWAFTLECWHGSISFFSACVFFFGRRFLAVLYFGCKMKNRCFAPEGFWRRKCSHTTVQFLTRSSLFILFSSTALLLYAW